MADRDILNTDIEEYFPPHIKQIKEFQQIAKAMNYEICMMWENASVYELNQYINTMDESQCEYYEKKILNISSLKDDTLQDRRDRIMASLVSTLPYTENRMIETLDLLCGGSKNYVLLIEPKNYTINVGIKLASVKLSNNIRDIVEKMAPANMVRNIYIIFNRWSNFKKQKWGDLKEKTWTEMRNDEKWQKGVMK